MMQYNDLNSLSSFILNLLFCPATIYLPLIKFNLPIFDLFILTEPFFLSLSAPNTVYSIIANQFAIISTYSK